MQDKYPTIINCSATESSNGHAATIFIITKGDFFKDTAWRAFIPDIIKTEIEKGIYSGQTHFFSG